MADYTFLHSETFDDGAIVRLASAGHAGERPLQLDAKTRGRYSYRQDHKERVDGEPVK